MATCAVSVRVTELWLGRMRKALYFLSYCFFTKENSTIVCWSRVQRMVALNKEVVRGICSKGAEEFCLMKFPVAFFVYQQNADLGLTL